MPEIPASECLRQEGCCKFEVSCGCIPGQPELQSRDSVTVNMKHRVSSTDFIVFGWMNVEGMLELVGKFFLLRKLCTVFHNGYCVGYFYINLT